MRFPGDPLSRQDRQRGEDEGVRSERERVMRLIAQRKNQAQNKRTEYLNRGDMDKQVDEAIKIDVLNELERAVRRGWQR